MSAFNGTEVVAKGLRDVQPIMKPTNDLERSVRIQEVAYIPGVFILLSQETLSENGVDLAMVKGYGYQINDQNIEFTAVAPRVGKLFPLDKVHPDRTPLIRKAFATTSGTLEL
jgi:hypothetical protein